MRTPALKVVVSFALVALTGCSSIGPKKLVSTHQGYNEAVQLAESREVLLNIVRLRFGDPVQFLTVSQINAQFSVGVTASGGAGNIGGEGPTVGSVGGQVSYSDTPTITFNPRSDDQQHRDLLNPVHLYEAVQFATRGGVYDSAMLALITSGINDAPDLPGPNGELYSKRLDAIHDLVKGDLAWVAHGKRWVPKSAIAVAVDDVTAFDHVWATNNGYLWVDAEPILGSAGRGKALMAFEYHTPLLVIRNPEDPVTSEHLRTLGLDPGHKEYVIRAVNDEIALGAPPTFIYLGFRSLKEIMGIVSEYVEIPSEIEARGVVPRTRYRKTGEYRLAFKVRSSKAEPRDALYRVELHGYWFWIDPADQESKAILEALYYMYQSQQGATTPGDPILTLPTSPPGP
jgi:hypothetical protein